MQQPQPWKIMDISPQSKTINDWLAQSSTSTSSATRMISLKRIVEVHDLYMSFSRERPHQPIREEQTKFVHATKKARPKVRRAFKSSASIAKSKPVRAFRKTRKPSMK
jgi:hypothetical protein